MEFDDIIGIMILSTFVFMLAVESIWPARKFARVPGWIFVGFCFFVIIMVVNTLLPLAVPLPWVKQHALFDGTRMGLAGGAAVGIVAVTFVDYWVHRAEHKFGFLWRWVHQLHHSAERVDIPGSVYFHPIDMILLALEGIAINILILGLDPRAAAIAGFIGAFLGMLQHWNVRTPHWLGYAIQRPEAHYRHHERDVHAWNYANLPVWDILFGTFYNPRQTPDDLTTRVGFAEGRGRRFWAMLSGRDVNADIPAFTHFK
jgi:sterol desaturase/sphingolipid hydroxylase (fatty acid hydroxylase superfamily)